MSVRSAKSNASGGCSNFGGALTPLGGPTGTKFLSLVCHTESKMEVPLTLAVVAARHPLLDGVTHQVLLCDPVKELMRSGKHSERER